MAVIRLFASRAMDGQVPMDGPLGLRLTFYYSVPPSWSKRKREEAIWKWSKPDGDNLQKLVKDACNRIVWVDDAQVADWSGRKIYGDREEIRVEVWKLDPTAQPEG